MNKIFKKIGEKIKQFVTFKNKLSEEKNIDIETFVEFEKSDEDKIIKLPINKNYEPSARLIISPSLKRIRKRIIENKRLSNILMNTRKNRTKKKLSKRIKKNNTLNKLDK